MLQVIPGVFQLHYRAGLAISCGDGIASAELSLDDANYDRQSTRDLNIEHVKGLDAMLASRNARREEGGKVALSDDG